MTTEDRAGMGPGSRGVGPQADEHPSVGVPGPLGSLRTVSEPSGGMHGYVRYTGGCRCAVCRAAKARYTRERRAAARKQAAARTVTPDGKRPNGANAWAVGAERPVVQGVKHGTRFAYEERGCRCKDCTDARTASDRRYRSGASRT